MCGDLGVLETVRLRGFFQAMEERQVGLKLDFVETKPHELTSFLNIIETERNEWPTFTLIFFNYDTNLPLNLELPHAWVSPRTPISGLFLLILDIIVQPLLLINYIDGSSWFVVFFFEFPILFKYSLNQQITWKC